jgi:hypothetical protein
MSEYAQSTENYAPATLKGLSIDELTTEESLDRIVDTENVSYYEASQTLVSTYAAEGTGNYSPASSGETETESKPKDLQERLSEVNERFRFKPFSERELSDIISLEGQDFTQGAARFLNSVLLRQRGVNDSYIVKNKTLPIDDQITIDENMPRRSVESIVGRYSSYAFDAQRQYNLLLNLSSMVDDRSKLRSEAASSVPILMSGVWDKDGSTAAPLKTILQASNIDVYIEDGKTARKPFDDQSEDETISQINKIISKSKVGNLQDTLGVRAAESERRKQYWVEKLGEARKHNAVSKAAEKALETLGVSRSDS